MWQRKYNKTTPKTVRQNPLHFYLSEQRRKKSSTQNTCHFAAFFCLNKRSSCAFISSIVLYAFWTVSESKCSRLLDSADSQTDWNIQRHRVIQNGINRNVNLTFRRPTYFAPISHSAHYTAATGIGCWSSNIGGVLSSNNLTTLQVVSIKTRKADTLWDQGHQCTGLFFQTASTIWFHHRQLLCPPPGKDLMESCDNRKPLPSYLAIPKVVPSASLAVISLSENIHHDTGNNVISYYRSPTNWINVTFTQLAG